MKSDLAIKKILLLLTIITATNSFAQTDNKEKIRATWNLSRLEILKTLKDSLAIQEQMKDLSLTFQKDSLVITRRKTGESDEFIKSGPYRLSDDGKKIFLQNDPGEIVTLDQMQLVVRVQGEYVMYLIKQPTAK